MDGRREIGGKIEVKVRLHHPLSGLKEDFVKEKWLIIDSVHKKTKVCDKDAVASGYIEFCKLLFKGIIR